MDHLKLADRSWPVLTRLMGGHAAVYRATNGLIGHRFPGAPPMLLLDHVGARSGVRRTSPLVYARDGGDVILVASKGGYPKNPAWFHNLMANPDTSIQIGSARRQVHARRPTRGSASACGRWWWPSTAATRTTGAGPSGRSRSSSSSRVSDAGRAGRVGGATPQGSASSERAVAERGTARWSGSEPIMRSPIVEVTPNQ
jgi:F420H(2)-dependent quinone reductase